MIATPLPPCHLLELPVEILKMILRFSVILGEVDVGSRFGDDKDYGSDSSLDWEMSSWQAECVKRLSAYTVVDDAPIQANPELRLFNICHQLRREFAELFFSENMFVFGTMGIEYSKDRTAFQPTYWKNLPLFQTPNFADLRTLAYRMMRNVSISFDYRDCESDALDFDMAPKVRQKISAIEHPPNPRLFVSADGDSARSLRLFDGWVSLATNTIGAGTRFLQLDVTYCYCRRGCCRLVEAANIIPSILVSFPLNHAHSNTDLFSL